MHTRTSKIVFWAIVAGIVIWLLSGLLTFTYAQNNQSSFSPWALFGSEMRPKGTWSVGGSANPVNWGYFTNLRSENASTTDLDVAGRADFTDTAYFNDINTAADRAGTIYAETFNGDYFVINQGITDADVIINVLDNVCTTLNVIFRRPAAVDGDLAFDCGTGAFSFNGALTATNLSGTNSGDVTLAGTPDYITISGQTITRGQIDLATDVTGTLPVTSGGTGATSFGQGWLHSNGTSLTSSTSPTVNYLTSTSTTATSTFAGDVQVNGGTLTVRASDNRVGINITNPLSPLHLKGTGFSTAWNSYNGLYIDSSGVTPADGSYGTGIGFSKLGSTAVKKAGIAPVQTGADDDTVGLALFASQSSLSTDPLVEYMRIASGGNIGIGTTSPQRKLHITNTGANAQLLLEDTAATTNQHYGSFGFSRGNFSINTMTDALASTTRLFIDSSGNVGINTTSPVSQFEVKGNATGTIMTLSSGDTSIDVGDILGMINFYSNDSSSNATGIGASIMAQSVGSHIASNRNTDLIFSTTGNNTTLAEAMRLDRNGFLGLHNSAPESEIEVTDTTGDSYITISNNTDEFCSGNYYKRARSASSETGGAAIKLCSETDIANSSLEFHVLSSMAFGNIYDVTGAFLIGGNAGSLGAGRFTTPTQAPSATLHVVPFIRNTTAGTVTATNGSNSFATTNDLTSHFAVGDSIRITNPDTAPDEEFYTVVTAINSTTITTLNTYTGTNSTTATASKVSTTHDAFRVDTGAQQEVFSIAGHNPLAVWNEGGLSTADWRMEGDTDSGLFFLDASADLIGIGTAAPTTKLQVAGVMSVSGSSGGIVTKPRDGSGTDFQWYNSTGDDIRLYAGSDLLTVNTLGLVGIGDTSPVAALAITPAGDAVTNVATTFLAGTTTAISASANTYLYPFEFQYGAGVNKGRLQFSPYRRNADSGTDWPGTGFRLQYAVDNSFTDGSRANIFLGTADDTTLGGGLIALSTGGSERLNVTNAGNVGIGTTTPNSILNVWGVLRTKLGLATADAPVGNTVWSDVTAANTGSVTTEVTLLSKEVPANTLGTNGDWLLINVNLRVVVNDTDTVTTRFKWGGQTIYTLAFQPLNSEDMDELVQIRIKRLTATTQEITFENVYGNVFSSFRVDGTQTLSSANNFVVTGQISAVDGTNNRIYYRESDARWNPDN